MANSNDNKIKNIRGFLTAYLNSRSGKEAISRTARHSTDWCNPAIAVAFQNALT